MTILSVKDLSLTQPTKTLFKNATFSLNATDKMAVIGPNGCGKTTLLKLIANVAQDPHESVVIQRGLRITYLSQHDTFNPDDTILDHIYNSNSAAAKAVKEYQLCLELLTSSPSSDLDDRFSAATENMDAENAWDYEDIVNSILRELDIHDLSQKMSTLSGGMQKKIAFAKVFFEETDLLVLDEPTNHLDVKTIEWLEGMLAKQRSAILMVTHDRYFLDKVCTHILEIDQEKVFAYKGNYLTYLERREQRYHDQAKKEASVKSVLRVELAWLRRGPKARSTKQKARKDRIAGIQNREKVQIQEQLELNVAERRLGKKILKVEEVSKSFDDRLIINNFSYTFKQKERLGILGPNGAGKTTLLNLIMTKLRPDKGFVDVGVNTEFGYFDQHSQDFDPDMTIYEHVNEIGSQIKMHDGVYISASKLLEKFLFPSQMLGTLIGRLSGGEKRRLHLVCLLLKNPNFLIFDEPTNDLDIQTLSVLEDFLINFAGCIIIISHDRYFMDRVVDKLLVFNTTGDITSFIGNYSDYANEITQSKPKQSDKPTPSKNSSQASPSKSNQPTLSKEEQKEMRKLETEIERLESEKKDLDNFFLDASGSLPSFQEAGKRLKEIKKEIEEKTALWEKIFSK